MSNGSSKAGLVHIGDARYLRVVRRLYTGEARTLRD
jgi:hypothetical protein